MGLYVNPSNEAFKEALSAKVYIDKSEMISVTNSLLDTEQKFMCVSRPRRFGKTMGVSLLVAYYSKGCDSKELFSNLKIANNPDFETHLNKHNVISLSLTKFREAGRGVETLLPTMINEIKRELKEEFPQIVTRTDKPLLIILSEIYKQTNEKFIFFIDEWDYIFREFPKRKIQEEYVDYLIVLFKGSPYVKLAYLTGVLPVKKHNTLSAMSCFDEYSMVHLGSMDKYFGFSEDEVKALCTKYNRDFDEIKAWYNGYIAPDGKPIFKPRSVIKSLEESKLKSYWIATSSFGGLIIPINLEVTDLRRKILELMGGKRVSANVTFVRNSTIDIRFCDEALTHLLHIGYLAYDEETKELFIPNHETRAEFDKAIKRSDWNEIHRAYTNSEDLLDSTWNCEEKKVLDYIGMAHKDVCTVFKYNDENALRSVIYLAYSFAINYYYFVNEFPKGEGYADLMLVPYKNVNKPLIVIEFKHKKTAASIIEQVREKKYPKSLEKYTGEVLLVSLGYDDDRKHYCTFEKFVKS